MHMVAYAMLGIHETATMEPVFHAYGEHTRPIGSLRPLIALIAQQGSIQSSRIQAYGANAVVPASMAQNWETKMFARFAVPANIRQLVAPNALIVLQVLISLYRRVLRAIRALQERLVWL